MRQTLPLSGFFQFKMRSWALFIIALLPIFAYGQNLQLYVNGKITGDNQRIESFASGQLIVSSVPANTTLPTGTYEWLQNEQTVVSTAPSYSVTSAGVYQLRFNGTQLSNSIIVNFGTISSAKNYIITDQARNSGIKETQDLNSNYNQASVSALFNQQVTYFDGFSRPLQRISINSSASTASDVVQPYTYGAQGEQTKSYLPYAAGNSGEFKTNWQSDQSNFYTYSPKVGRPGNNGPTYAEVLSDNDPLGRVTEKASPGEPWKMGGGHTQVVTQRSNTTNDNVRLWSYTVATAIGTTGTLTWATTASAANTLAVAVDRDEDNKWTIAFSNEKGQLVCQRTYLSGNPESASTNDSYLETNYAYDAAGHLLAVVPPKAVQLLFANSATATTSFQNQYLFLTQYDVLGRAIARKVPGKGWVFNVYDRWDRVAATQDKNQYDRGVWSFTKYDALNRAVMTGEIYESRDVTTLATALQNWPIDKRAETREDSETGYTLTNTFPSATVNDVTAVIYYDDYDYYPLRPAQRADLAFVAENGFNTPSTQTRGLATGGRKRLFSGTWANQWLTSVMYYDQYGRVAQVLDDNITHNANGPAVDRTTTSRLFTGETGITLLTHHRYDDAGTLETHTTNNYNIYDGKGRLTQSLESIDGAPYVTLQKFEYNDLGQVVDKKLGYDYDNAAYIQSLDYRYNVRGWLTNINNRNLSNNEWLDNNTPNSDTEPQDAFGLELKYDAGSTATGCYNGNISAAVWNTSGGKMRQYAYTYDKANRLKESQYGALKYANGVFSFTNEQDDARREGNYTLSGIEYDPNGNITALNRSGLLSRNAAGDKVFGRIDELAFSHDGNRLNTVTDGVVTSAAGNDFENGSTTGVAYVYDNNGNMTYDPNKGAHFYYNQFNLPWYISFDNGNGIYTIYTSDGQKAGTTYYSYSQTGYAEKTVLYIKGFTYSTNPQEPLTVSTVTGRALFEAAATQSSPAAWAHEYHIRDHQGSLRLVLKQEPVLHYRMTMEEAYASEEEAQFKRVAETRQLDASHARTGYYSARLNAYQVDRSNGPATMMQVAAGDSIHMEVFGLYDKGVFAPGISKAVTPVFAVGGSLGASNFNGPDNQATSQRRWMPSVTAGIAVAWDKLHGLFGKHREIPKASFTYELYNKDSILVKSATCQLSATGQPEWQQLQHGFRAKEAGYIKVYLANASGTDAWFDDMTLSRFPVPTTQENHYDPLGQNIEEIEIASSFDSKEQYTGQERVNDFGLEWTDFGARYYDPQLGRWHTPDPAEQYISPYTGMGNNAVNGVDPDGRWFGLDDLAAMAIGGVGNLVSAAMAGKITSLEKGLVYFGVGAIGGEAALLTGGLGGFAIGGTLNAAADAYYGEFKGMSTGRTVLGVSLSVLSGGLNAVGAGNAAKMAFPAQGVVGVESLTAKFLPEATGAAAPAVEVASQAAIELNGGINVTQKGLAHVMQRHTYNTLAKWAGKSKFYNASEVETLIKQATHFPVALQSSGNYQRIIDAGRVIGLDRLTGNPTSIYTVVTNKLGNLVTAFPGIP